MADEDDRDKALRPSFKGRGGAWKAVDFNDFSTFRKPKPKPKPKGKPKPTTNNQSSTTAAIPATAKGTKTAPPEIANVVAKPPTTSAPGVVSATRTDGDGAKSVGSKETFDNLFERAGLASDDESTKDNSIESRTDKNQNGDDVAVAGAASTDISSSEGQDEPSSPMPKSPPHRAFVSLTKSSNDSDGKDKMPREGDDEDSVSVSIKSSRTDESETASEKMRRILYGDPPAEDNEGTVEVYDGPDKDSWSPEDNKGNDGVHDEPDEDSQSRSSSNNRSSNGHSDETNSAGMSSSASRTSLGISGGADDQPATMTKEEPSSDSSLSKGDVSDSYEPRGSPSESSRTGSASVKDTSESSPLQSNYDSGGSSGSAGSEKSNSYRAGYKSDEKSLPSGSDSYRAGGSLGKSSRSSKEATLESNHSRTVASERGITTGNSKGSSDQSGSSTVRNEIVNVLSSPQGSEKASAIARILTIASPSLSTRSPPSQSTQKSAVKATIAPPRETASPLSSRASLFENEKSLGNVVMKSPVSVNSRISSSSPKATTSPMASISERQISRNIPLLKSPTSTHSRSSRSTSSRTPSKSSHVRSHTRTGGGLNVLQRLEEQRRAKEATRLMEEERVNKMKDNLNNEGDNKAISSGVDATPVVLIERSMIDKDENAGMENGPFNLTVGKRYEKQERHEGGTTDDGKNKLDSGSKPTERQTHADVAVTTVAVQTETTVWPDEEKVEKAESRVYSSGEIGWLPLKAPALTNYGEAQYNPSAENDNRPDPSVHISVGGLIQTFTPMDDSAKNKEPDEAFHGEKPSKKKNKKNEQTSPPLSEVTVTPPSDDESTLGTEGVYLERFPKTKKSNSNSRPLPIFDPDRQDPPVGADLFAYNPRRSMLGSAHPVPGQELGSLPPGTQPGAKQLPPETNEVSPLKNSYSWIPNEEQKLESQDLRSSSYYYKSAASDDSDSIWAPPGIARSRSREEVALESRRIYINAIIAKKRPGRQQTTSSNTRRYTTAAVSLPSRVDFTGTVNSSLPEAPSPRSDRSKSSGSSCSESFVEIDYSESTGANGHSESTRNSSRRSDTGHRAHTHAVPLLRPREEDSLSSEDYVEIVASKSGPEVPIWPMDEQQLRAVPFPPDPSREDVPYQNNQYKQHQPRATPLPPVRPPQPPPPTQYGQPQYNEDSYRSDFSEDIKQMAPSTPEKALGFSESFRSMKRRRIAVVIILFVVFLVLAAIAVAVTLILVDRKSNNDEGAPAPAPTSPPNASPESLPSLVPTLPPVDSPNASPPTTGTPPSGGTPSQGNTTITPPSEDTPTEGNTPTASPPIFGTPTNGNSLFDLVVTAYPQSETALQDPSSPQSRALEWLELPANTAVTTEETYLQRYALATLYHATNGDEWIDNTSWLTSTNECSWISTKANSLGICDPLGRYVEVNLRENNLVGELPSELSILSNSLKVINVAGNSIEGQIPTFIVDMDLELFDISSNQLSGTIPASLGSATSLKQLSLFENNLFSTIPSSLGSLGQLEVLDLGSNQLTGTVPPTFGDLTRLAGLSVFGNVLSGTVPIEIGNLQGLELLYIDSNDFRTPLSNSICDLDLLEFWSDCEEIQCLCCTTCCSDGFGCFET